MTQPLRQQVSELRALLGLPVSEAVKPDLKALFTEMFVLLSSLKGRSWPTSREGVSLALDGVMKPMRDPMSDGIEFVLPLDVRYEGKAPPEIWAEAETALESEIRDAVKKLVAARVEGATATFVSRTKADPYPDDPKSMTMLRFRIA